MDETRAHEVIFETYAEDWEPQRMTLDQATAVLMVDTGGKAERAGEIVLARVAELEAENERLRGEEWEPGKYWRVVDGSGELWCESSGQQEVVRSLETSPGGGTLQQLWQTKARYEWRPPLDAAPTPKDADR